jgi:3-phosphoglycerate kinase
MGLFEQSPRPYSNDNEKMNKLFIDGLDLKGKTVFVRNDFNVPLDKEGNITDDTRIRASLKTLEYLIEKGAKIVCASHLGRPKGEIKPEFSLKPVSIRLAELLKRDIIFEGETIGEKIESIKAKLKSGEILLLENLRFFKDEKKNGEKLAKELAKGIDIYINDAFGTCHRAHCSMVKITEFIDIAAAGFLLKKEIEYLGMAVSNPPVNYTAIMGGAKVSDKIPILKNLIYKASSILIGGAMAYSFLKAKGLNTGNSLVEEDQIDTCKEIMKTAEKRNVKIMLPVDHIAAVKIEPNVTVRLTKEGEDIPDSMMGLDIGMETVKLYSEEIKNSELIVWNGPMGVFEIELFSGGTTEIAKSVANSNAISIIGGGDSISAINKLGLADKITHISTGGGAALEFLSGEKLPGIEALTDGK